MPTQVLLDADKMRRNFQDGVGIGEIRKLTVEVLTYADVC
jgi:hypothetical protein